MIANDIQLEGKLVGEIEGRFIVPSYQRGYRWDETQVTALLEDIYENKDKPYCLQPVVVRKDEQGRYELIDGQQRLTTLFILYKYMQKLLQPIQPTEIKYSLVYETRSENERFFENMEDEELACSNIDFYHINQAYKTIKEWFGEKKNELISAVGDFLKWFNNNVQVIWYELESGTREDAISLFTRLNIGRIPLTNAELVKALYLSSKGAEETPEERYRKLELAIQWDTLERELHDEDFWYFLTKNNSEDYPNRIELLFDFITSARENKKDIYSVFLHFSKQPTPWEDILKYYYRLKEWYRNDNYYRKIGYLVASGYRTIDELMIGTSGKRKSEMDDYLDEEIMNSIFIDKPYEELSYENSRDYVIITRILLLFNVVSLKTSRFPFKEFNTERWSLEHIHAQNSEKLNTQKKWKEWLEEHIDSVKDIGNQYLAAKIKEAIDNENLTRPEFNELADQIIQSLSENGKTEYIHSIANMALLQGGANSALNNSVFDVKRRKIKKMDMNGEYIPYCTKMVFFKYYTQDKVEEMNFHYWGEKDREAYVAAINKELEYYFRKKMIHYEQGRVN